MQIWAVANQKGGVGKTTTTLALGARLAADGARVLLLDLDPHASLTRCFGLPTDPPPAGSAQLFDDPPQPLRELIHHSDYERVDLVPGQAALAVMEKRSATRPGLGLAVKTALASVHDAYDYALLDCPPTLGVLMVNALAAADRLIIPTQTDPLALHGLDGMVRTAAMIERSRGGPLPVFILPTLHDRRTRAGAETLTQMQAQHGQKVWDDVIPLDTRLRDAALVLSAPPVDRGGKGLAAYASALQWLLQHERQQVAA